MSLPRPLLVEPQARAAKPDATDLPPSVTRQIEKLCNAKITGASYAEGGFSVSAAFIFTLGSGSRVFVKGAHPGDTAHGVKNIAQEILTYESVAALRDVSPRYIGMVSDGEDDGWLLGVWEAVAHDPARASIERAVASLAQWQHAPDAERALPPARTHNFIGQLLSPERKWARLRHDEIPRKKFLGLFQDARAAQSWFAASIDALCQNQARALKDGGAEGLLHGDLRLDNFLFGPERTWVIDWPNACKGPLAFDLVFLFTNMEALGFGRTEELLNVYAETGLARPGIETLSAITCALSGYFADQAYRDLVDKMPRLRWMQRSMLLAQLRFLARLGVIESPPGMIGENQ